MRPLFADPKTGFVFKDERGALFMAHTQGREE